MRSAALLAVVVAACSTTDDRPQTLAFITETILAPNCAGAECHSSFRKEYGYVFDTVEHAQQSIDRLPLLCKCQGTPPCHDNIGTSFLMTVITTEDSQHNRMPLDHPLANKDIDFLATWIENDADGYVASDASTLACSQ